MRTVKAIATPAATASTTTPTTPAEEDSPTGSGCEVPAVFVCGLLGSVPEAEADAPGLAAAGVGFLAPILGFAGAAGALRALGAAPVCFSGAVFSEAAFPGGVGLKAGFGWEGVVERAESFSKAVGLGLGVCSAAEVSGPEFPCASAAASRSPACFPDEAALLVSGFLSGVSLISYDKQ